MIRRPEWLGQSRNIGLLLAVTNVSTSRFPKLYGTPVWSLMDRKHRLPAQASGQAAEERIYGNDSKLLSNGLSGLGHSLQGILVVVAGGLLGSTCLEYTHQ